MIRTSQIISRIIPQNIRTFSIYDIQERFEENSPQIPPSNTFSTIPEPIFIPCDTCTCDSKEDCWYNDIKALTED